MAVSRERLADLLVDPSENLDCEVKNWLDLQDSNDDKAILAKAVLAIANHGGGFLIIGMVETDTGIVEADGRPVTLDDYSQDLINGIVQNYCDPPFHTAVHMVSNPVGALFPVVVIPGGHRVPIRSRRAGPNGNTVLNNTIYIRKAGPRSEAPQSAQDWEDLLGRCFHNRRDEMFDQIRDLITGAVPQVTTTPQPALLDEWIEANWARWRRLIEGFPEDAQVRLPHGRYSIAYEITGERQFTPPGHLPEVLRASVVRHTGWPPFWYPSRAGIEPYPIDGAVECWIGGDTDTPIADRDAAHSDYWRIHPDGFAFLLRGFDEDGSDAQQNGRNAIPPGTMFDITLPIWRVGETLLHARRLSLSLFDGPTTIKFAVTYEGLAGRSLVSIDHRRHVWDKRIARQDTIVLNTHIDSQAIEQNLPEIVHPLLSPLYALFDFFDLPMATVIEELNRMREGRF